MISILNVLSLPATDSARDNGLLGLSDENVEGSQPFSQLFLGEKNRLSPNTKLQDLAASIKLSNEPMKTEAPALPLFDSQTEVPEEVTVLAETLPFDLVDVPEHMPTDTQALFAFLMARAGTSVISDLPSQPEPLTIVIDDLELVETLEPEITEGQDQQPFSLIEELPLPVLDFLKQAISKLPPDHPVKQWLVDQQVIGSQAATDEVAVAELSDILTIITDELAKTETNPELLAWITDEVQPVLNPMMIQFAAELTRKPTQIFNAQQSLGDVFSDESGDEPKEAKPAQVKTDAGAVGTAAQGFKESPIAISLMALAQPLEQSVTGLRTTMQAELSAQNELSNAVKQMNSVNAVGEEVPELQEIRLEFLARQLQAPANAGVSNPVAISELMSRQLASSPEFQSALNERIMTMVNGELKHAVIRLDPPELGALEIRIQVNQDQTSIQIISANPQVREALEAQSVRLREALVEQGMQLANFDVSGQGSQSGNEQRQADANDELLASEVDSDGQNNDVVSAALMSNRLVDDYA